MAKKTYSSNLIKCRQCGKMFPLDKYHSRYCSHECKMKKRSDFQKKNYSEKAKERRWKLRFELLKDANFTCQYCGRKAPNVILHIDHKIPKSKGGKNEKNNYIVACMDCNLGKHDILLNE